MGSRVREDVSDLFICFCEVARPDSNSKDGWIIQKFPDNYDDREILNTIPKFVFPCEIDHFSTIQHFSFVLTNVESKWTFGFCRHDPKSATALVFLSYLPWHEVFFRILNTTSELIRSCEAKDLSEFLEFMMKSDLPEPNSKFVVRLNKKLGTFSCTIPAPYLLPTIPESRNLTEYYSAVETNNMLVIFASMLYERRIVFKSRKLHRLSACVQAANTVIYPMSWQHIFIPLLPRQLTDYLLAPMPFLIGVPSSTWETVRKADIGEIVLLDTDSNIVETPFHDLESLPVDVVKFLKTQLKNQSAMLEDGFARTFLKALVQLIGGYRDALKFQQGKKITFCPDAFVESRPPSMQAFLRDMLHLQIFQQFVEERLNMLNAGLGFSDEFEFEACNYSAQTSNSIINDQYKDWLTTMKKQGSALLKTMKNKANPAMKSAVRTVKEKGKDVKSAYKGIKTRMRKDGNSQNSSTTEPPSTAHRTRPLTVGSSVSAATTFKKSRATSVVTSRSNEYVPLHSPDEQTSPQNDDDLPAPRLDMDLLGDLQDVINRQCTLLDKSPPVDRTLKPVRSLDSFSANEEYGYLEPRAFPVPAGHSQTLPDVTPHSPLSRTSLSLPLSPPSSVAPSNPFAFSFLRATPSPLPDPFNSESEHFQSTNPFYRFPLSERLNPVISVPSINTYTYQPIDKCNGKTDLIRLDSTPSEQSALSRECSDDSIKFKTGLMNPLYPYYTIPKQSPAHTQSNTTPHNITEGTGPNGVLSSFQSLQTNKSFVHTSNTARNAEFNKQDMDLLKEYGIDFKSQAGTRSTLANFDPFDVTDPSTKAASQNNWMKFD